jgi:hypothetical protein
MTSLTSELFGMPTSTRAARALDAAGERVADHLAGRTVWCATAVPAARDRAGALLDRLAWGGVAAEALEVHPEEPFELLAERLDSMLAGEAGWLGAEDRQMCAELDADALAGTSVMADDVVVLGDPLTAMLAEALRERGAHVVARLRIEPSAADAWSFVHGLTSCMDAYLVVTPAHGRGPVETVAAVLPCPGLVAEKEFAAASEQSRDIGWGAALAEVVRGDRDEVVGGRLHPRPAVAAR